MTSCNTQPHCTWCAKPKNATVIAAAGANRSLADVSTELGMNRNSVTTIITLARARGCSTWKAPPQKPRGRSTIRRMVMCPLCRKPVETKRGGTVEYGWCSTACRKEGNLRGIGIYNQEDPRELGPESPLIPTDEEGMYRRALEAARDGVLVADMEERFGQGMTKRARAQVAREQPPVPRGVPSWYGDPGRLPAGLPVW